MNRQEYNRIPQMDFNSHFNSMLTLFVVSPPFATLSMQVYIGFFSLDIVHARLMVQHNPIKKI